ncbi:methylmalonyl-CoA mutase family protein [Ancylobacter defluvii]|uniref:Methylmalonyl-CoA mutase n=1 Tax=Ancylobacter defluvii TaxID=1282440 RepID=A0A9W6JZ24_9HYPH|nr:methylmalonyl-CoA mutase family protein [Ancylobacter defluvii]MBS7589512.1 methylmalonyl-CoA mutase [Ancylobacter defluvii]GLK85128.1 methylmalonyl-CoA mutase [Ancylobacter defluvii]
MERALDLDLASFPATTREDWLKLVEGVLKGAPYDRRMVTHTYDGLALDALPARRADTQLIATRAGTPWKLLTRIDHTDPAAANAQALDDLAGGADGLSLVFAGAPAAYGFGLPVTREAIAATLEGVMADLVTLRVEAGRFQGRDVALALAALLENRDPHSLDLRFGLDPLGDLAALGAAPIEWQALSARLGQTVAALRLRGFSAPMVRADGRLHHAAGATEVQELAAVLATALAYLRALEASGLSLEDSAPLIEVTLAADVDQFLTLSKPRALRLIWAAALEACGVASPPPLAIHMETAWRSLTRLDPHTNLLRGTLAAFAAGVGGADSLTVLPFTQALGLPDGFARRLARNTQLILIEESNIHRVADPAAGAGAVEERTEKLAAAAWALFRDIEKEGGLVEALQSGSWQRRIGEARTARARNIATRRTPITGTSEFPLLGAATPSVLAPLPRMHTPAPAEGALLVEPLAPHRLAEPFEALRAIAERAEPRPAVFLASLGTPADFTVRAGFARNLFEAGGIAAPGHDGFNDEADLVAGFRASGARLACLCSSDALYLERAEVAAQALKQAGAAAVYLAGRLPEQEAALRAAGVAGFAFAGGDALELLRSAHAALGLAPRAEEP